MKTCSKCKQEKHIDKFHNNKSNPDGKTYHCADCLNAKYKEYFKSPRAKKLQRARNRKLTTGFTKEYWDETFEAQGGKCAICGTEDPGKLDFCADHNHETKQPRGILCRKCNSGIGLLKDDVELLEAAIKYLEHYKALQKDEL